MTAIDIAHHYKSLPKSLKAQLKSIESYFYSNPKIIKRYKESLKSLGNFKRHQKSLFRLFLLNNIDSRDLLHEQWFFVLSCYDCNGKKPDVKLLKVIKTGKHAVVMLGQVANTNDQVIVKWYQSHRRDIEYETGIYKRLDKMGCPLLRFTSSYKFWDSPVLILEKLEPLQYYDNEYEMGSQIIYQLSFLHQFGVHSDIKPQNIMKRVRPDKIDYLLIDFGGVATERLGYGYRRWLWSPKWTSQKPHEENQITTPVHDFIELGYTMKCIQNWSTNYGKTDGECKKNFRGKLARYMDYVLALDKEKPVRLEDYQNLIRILQA